MNETKQYGIKPYARLLTMLGDQLISSERVALVELVKNSYDADASWVKISFNNFEEVLNENHKRMDIKKTPSSSITIEEDGCGMSQDIILKHWLNPATPEKKNRKTAKATTPKGRLIQGEKGIGRFAIFKLGKKIKIITRSDKQNTFSESVIQYDFSGYNEDFVNEEGRNLMLDEIRVQVGERIPELFVERNVQWDNSIHVVKPHGTFIEISDLKGDWNLNKIREISYDFSCLQSIFDEKKDEQLDFGLDDGNSFSVKIFINQQQERDENDPHEALMGLIQEKAVFKIIKGHFDDKKNRYSFTLGEKDHFKDQFVDLSNAIIMGKSIFRKNFGPHGEVLRERKITCGPFDFEFYIFDFTLKSTEEKGLNVDEKKSIRKHRIYLYRDGIRVYPYGDEKDDWLQIDMSRGTISSGEYLSNDQVVGCIKISQKNNPDLRDKTNREGLIQGTETSDFIALIQIFLKYVRDEIYGKQYLELKKEKRRNEIVEEKEVVNHFSDLRNAVGNNPKVLKVLNETEVLYNKELSYYNERLKTTEDLAGVGLSVETASHDIMAFMSQVINNLSALLKDISNQEQIDYNSLSKNLKNTLDSANFVYGKLRNMQSLFKSSKQRKHLLIVKDLLDKVIEIYKRTLKKEGIEVSIETVGKALQANTTDAVILQLLINLFDNAVYWLQPMNIPQKRIEILLDGDKKIMIFSDNGPGVRADDEPYIFEPFFSGKGEDGRGLGLYIARQLLGRHNYTIDLVSLSNKQRLSGANFIINFNATEEEIF